ncbi:CLUMA_CG004392, isoform A [Clunio marinus]|uniref:CLUMA_CG004392, isoform A n=1 Tax=Clunio marinus TaxID=568069 RepID=A0A1J1HRL3_9DIPT|nr:CLUMA_CG004392, isoform A [Clunio marinus]
MCWQLCQSRKESYNRVSSPKDYFTSLTYAFQYVLNRAKRPHSINMSRAHQFSNQSGLMQNALRGKKNKSNLRKELVKLSYKNIKGKKSRRENSSKIFEDSVV